ncbi:hypothetical protein FS749_015702 [Ceratobasidium sp. UAMH 11750]|nr:hypothetical protein FS749_015702 [Ceratobasidium sp. UAMH 11750]
MFLLDLVDNIPRLRLSSEHLRLIIWVMKEAGCDDLPTLSQLRQTQQQLRNVCGVKSHQYCSSQGNFFDMLDIPQLVGRDCSNPLIAPHIDAYPEDSGNYLSESWQAKKWHENVPLDQLTPMYAQGGKLYYVNELARLHDGTLVISKRWITRDRVLTADCWPVKRVALPGDKNNAFTSPKKLFMFPQQLLQAATTILSIVCIPRNMYLQVRVSVSNPVYGAFDKTVG